MSASCTFYMVYAASVHTVLRLFLAEIFIFCLMFSQSLFVASL